MQDCAALSGQKTRTKKDAELAAMGAPGKPSVSGFAGERRSPPRGLPSGAAE